MIKLIENEKIGEELTNELESCKESIKIISPFLSKKMTDILCKIKQEKKISISVITRLYLQDMLKGSNDIYAIEKMFQSGINVMGVRGLHTKLYAVDDVNYFIGSANFTMNGLYKNLELILQIDKEESKIKDKLDEYYKNLENNCIKNSGLLDIETINEIKTAFEKVKEKRGNEASAINTKTYGASITREGYFKDFVDPEKTNDISKRKEIIASEESDPIGDAFKDKDTFVWSKEMDINYYLKLEGKKCSIFEKMVPVSVDLNGKKVYILNFPEGSKPAQITDGDVFYFCTGGDTDSAGSGIQRIIARGHLCAYEKDYYVKEEWKKEYPWMEKYNVYSVIRDIEVIDEARKLGIDVSEIIKKVGAKIIAGSSKNSFDPKDFSKSWEGSFKKSTKEASDVIDEEFEKLIAKYGHRTFYSDL